MKYDLNDFIIAGGYKYSNIKKYFKKKKIKNANIEVVNTGLNTLTGKRLKCLGRHADRNIYAYLWRRFIKY